MEETQPSGLGALRGLKGGVTTEAKEGISFQNGTQKLVRKGQMKKGVFGKGSFRNLCAELRFVFFCVLSGFSPANLTEISFRNCPSNAGIFWKTPSTQLLNQKRSKLGQIHVKIGSVRASNSGQGEWGMGVGVI